jgi:preprotein translocase subunit SecG
MTSTLLIVQIVLALAITISVLLQKSSSIGLGAYSGSNESMFGAKGPMGFLAKLTFTLALLFVLNTLVLGYLYTSENNKSVVDTITSSVPVSPEAAKAAASTAPAAPSAPAAETESSIPVPPKADAPANEEAPKPATH